MKAPAILYAIDPGKSGAIAIFERGRLESVRDCTPAHLYGLLQHHQAFGLGPKVAIERVQGLPGQSGPGMFAFGQGYGELLGVCLAMGVAPMLIQPATWKGALGLRREYGETTAKFKGRSLAMARELWPDAPWFKRAKDDGKAEAALIGHYLLTSGLLA